MAFNHDEERGEFIWGLAVKILIGFGIILGIIHFSFYYINHCYE